MKTIKQCEICNKDFYVRKDQFDYRYTCSKICDNLRRKQIYASKRLIKKCIICNTDMFLSLHEYEKKKCCNKKCANILNSINGKERMNKYLIKNNKQRIKKNCIICNSEFEVIPTYKSKQTCNNRNCIRKNMSMSRRGDENNNYRGGKYQECIVCKKQFWLTPSHLKSRKTCSRECFGVIHSLDMLGSKNYMFGKMHTNETKLKIRKKCLERINNLFMQQYNMPFKSNISPNEKPILDKLEEFWSAKIERQHFTSGFFTDGYIKRYNLFIEIDELAHYNYKNELKNKDILRQQIIENETGGQFLRIKVPN